MSKVLQINVTANVGSTGRIVEEIGDLARQKGWISYVGYGREEYCSSQNLIKIGSNFSVFSHVLKTRLFDRHGLASRVATKKFIKEIKEIKPDIIHLHNIHGYYINYPLLFNALREINVPVVWTLHDCWPFTGHCVFPTLPPCNCTEYQKACKYCKNIREYPKSILFSRSENNFTDKKNALLSLDKLTIVPVSYWLNNILKSSFLNQYPTQVIQNGVDISTFTPYYTTSSRIRKKYELTEEPIILGVASVWEKRKGLADFLELQKKLKNREIASQIVLVGLNKTQIKNLPEGIVGIERTNNISELAQLYNVADVFVNPTYADNFPTTNLEAMSCGTPVVSYDTGGVAEAITGDTGIVVPQGEVQKLASAVERILVDGKQKYTNSCRNHIVENFDRTKQFEKYIELYNSLLLKEKIIL